MMKKLTASLLILAMTLALTACGSSEKTETTQTPEETSQVVNPVVDYDSLEEINEVAQTNLASPDEEVSDESFSVIDGTIAQYIFTLDGISFNFRASQTEDDISGVYSGDGLLLDSMDEDGYAADETGKISEWIITENDTDTQYVLYAEDNGAMEENRFKELVSELQNRTVGVMSDEDEANQVYAVLEGDYSDETSERAVATVVNNYDSLAITVEWGDSATEMTTWTMNATFDSTEGLVYSDCVKKNITMNDDGEVENEEIVYENGSGYFGIDGKGNLLWLGAEEESCQECVFVKID